MTPSEDYGGAFEQRHSSNIGMVVVALKIRESGVPPDYVARIDRQGRIPKLQCPRQQQQVDMVVVVVVRLSLRAWVKRNKWNLYCVQHLHHTPSTRQHRILGEGESMLLARILTRNKCGTYGLVASEKG